MPNWRKWRRIIFTIGVNLFDKIPSFKSRGWFFRWPRRQIDRDWTQPLKQGVQVEEVKLTRSLISAYMSTEAWDHINLTIFMYQLKKCKKKKFRSRNTTVRRPARVWSKQTCTSGGRWQFFLHPDIWSWHLHKTIKLGSAWLAWERVRELNEMVSNMLKLEPAAGECKKSKQRQCPRSCCRQHQIALSIAFVDFDVTKRVYLYI